MNRLGRRVTEMRHCWGGEVCVWRGGKVSFWGEGWRVLVELGKGGSGEDGFMKWGVEDGEGH